MTALFITKRLFCSFHLLRTIISMSTLAAIDYFILFETIEHESFAARISREIYEDAVVWIEAFFFCEGLSLIDSFRAYRWR